jgi:hypothetical protein
LQSPAHHCFLRAEQFLIKATNGMESLPRAEEEATACQSHHAIHGNRNHFQEPAVKRNPAVKAERAPAAHRSSSHGSDSRRNSTLSHDRVGVDKDEQLAFGFPGPGVACGSDLPMSDRHHPSTVFASDGCGSVRGRIVNDDNLERLPKRFTRCVQRRQ